MKLKEEIFLFLEDMLDFILSPHTLYRAVTGLPLSSYYPVVHQIKKQKRTKTLKPLKLIHPDHLSKLIQEAQNSLNMPRDVNWHIVLFDIPETKRKIRLHFKNYLENLGYGGFQKSIFASPHNHLHEILSFAKDYGIEENIGYFKLASLLWPEGRRFVQKCWKLTSLQKRYEAFTQTFAKRIENFQTLSKWKDRPTLNHLALWLIKVMDQSLYEILRDDPLLPKSFLSKEWPLEEVLKLHKSWKEFLKSYL